MTPARLLLSASLVLGLTVSLRAQSVNDPGIEGVFFFHEFPFTDPAATAWPIEYRSAAANAKLVFITTSSGSHLRLKVDQVSDMLPYPGRGEVIPQNAIKLCEIALAKYPRHAALIEKIRQAWLRVTTIEYAHFAAMSEERQRVMEGVVAGLANDAENVKKNAGAKKAPSTASRLGPSPELETHPASGTSSSTESGDSGDTNGDAEVSDATQQYQQRLEILDSLSRMLKSGSQ